MRRLFEGVAHSSNYCNCNIRVHYIANQINNQSIIPSTDVIQLTLTLKMTTAQVVEKSVTVNNSPIQDYVHPDDQTQPFDNNNSNTKLYLKRLARNS